MTIIVAQKTTTGVLMGADETSVEGSRLFRRGTPKLANITPRLAVGVAGKCRIGDLVLTAEWPERCGCDAATYRATLADFFRDVLKDEPRDVHFWALVASDRDIYYVSAPGCVLLVNSTYCALGNAETVALGALFVANQDLSDLPDETRGEARVMLCRALDACSEHVEGIRPPWIFAETIAPNPVR